MNESLIKTNKFNNTCLYRCESTTWLSIAQIVRRVTSNFSGRDLWSCADIAVPFLEAITHLTCSCSSRLCAGEDQTWFSDVFGHLMIAWVSLASYGMVSILPDCGR